MIHPLNPATVGIGVQVLAGAGMSTSAGIPDFRSPKTGLYASQEAKNLFSEESLVERPAEFYALVKRLFHPVTTGAVKPTPSHAFVRLLQDKGVLQRLYT